MNDAPERLAMNRRHLLGRITSGPLMDHPNYQQYIREDIYEAVKAERDRLRRALRAMVGVAEFAEWDKARTGREIVLKTAKLALKDTDT